MNPTVLFLDDRPSGLGLYQVFEFLQQVIEFGVIPATPGINERR
jgi:hypothetical protein